MCSLGSGTAFGECVLNDGLHSVSVISNEPCTLLRVPKRDFQDIWQKSSHYMEEIVTSPFSISNVDTGNKPDSAAELETQAVETTNAMAKKSEQVIQAANSVEGQEEELLLPENVCTIHVLVRRVKFKVVCMFAGHETDARRLGHSTDYRPDCAAPDSRPKAPLIGDHIR